MSAASSAKLLAAGSAWRLTGLAAAGRTLVSAVEHGAEDERTLAGILLVQAGDRSVPLIRNAIAEGARRPELVDILASIGTQNARTALETIAHGAAPEIAGAAEQALRTLDEIRRRSK